MHTLVDRFCQSGMEVKSSVFLFYVDKAASTHLIGWAGATIATLNVQNMSVMWACQDLQDI